MYKYADDKTIFGSRKELSGQLQVMDFVWNTDQTSRLLHQNTVNTVSEAGPAVCVNGWDPIQK